MVYLFQDPLNSLFFFALLGTVFLAWCSPRVSIASAILTGFLGVYAHLLSWLGFALVLIMGTAIYGYYRLRLRSAWKILYGITLFACIWSFYDHLALGFQNWLVIDKFHFSHDSTPYNFYLSGDKILVGIFLFTLGQRLNQSFADWGKSLKYALLPFVLLTVILIGAALAVGYVRYDLKLPPYLWLWMLINFFFVCMTEEVFFRGFVQKELSILLKSIKGGQWLAILVAAIAFGLLHHSGGVVYIVLSAIAGVGYGYAYMKAQRIEAAMLTHFMVNLFHIIVFSYPALTGT